MVRTAGHVAGPEVLGSIQYGVSVLGSPLVVVLGHDACGAVAATRAAVADGTTAGGYVRNVVEKVTPSVLAARAAGRTEDADFIAEHIRHTVDLLLERSRALAAYRYSPFHARGTDLRPSWPVRGQAAAGVRSARPNRSA